LFFIARIGLQLGLLSVGRTGTPTGLADDFVSWLLENPTPEAPFVDSTALAFLRAERRGGDYLSSVATAGLGNPKSRREVHRNRRHPAAALRRIVISHKTMVGREQKKSAMLVA
jgi:hypothetical protein